MKVQIVTRTQRNEATGEYDEYQLFQLSAGDESFYIMPASYDYNGLQAVLEAA